jgi:hypothetical protein
MAGRPLRPSPAAWTVASLEGCTKIVFDGAVPDSGESPNPAVL